MTTSTTVAPTTCFVQAARGTAVETARTRLVALHEFMVGQAPAELAPVLVPAFDKTLRQVGEILDSADGDWAGQVVTYFLTAPHVCDGGREFGIESVLVGLPLDENFARHDIRASRTWA